MTDVNNQVVTTEPADVTPVGGAPDGGTLQAQPTIEELQAELVGTAAALRKANAEAAQRRKALTAFEEAEAKRKEAELSEIEKAQKATQEWEEKHNALVAELTATRTRSAFYEEIDAQKLTFPNAQAKKDAFALSDLSGVVMGDTGPEGMADAVKALTKSHPHLFAAPQPAANINALNAGGSTGAEPTDAQVAEFCARMGLDPRYVDKSTLAGIRI